MRTTEKSTRALLRSVTPLDGIFSVERLNHGARGIYVYGLNEPDESLLKWMNSYSEGIQYSYDVLVFELLRFEPEHAVQ
jgi:hypothetical protein